MRILPIVAGALVGILSAACAVADPSFPLAADDPAIGSGWRPPPSPTAGLRSFAPVGAKDWLKQGAPAAQDGADRRMDMKGRPKMGAAPNGSDMGSMPGMPGMGGGK